MAWRLTVCEAAGLTVAIGDGDPGDPGQIAQALRGLRASAMRSVGALEAQGQPLHWAGATPQAEAGHWRFEGRDAQGRPVRVALWLAVRGTRVVQATVVGQTLPEGSVQTFAEGLGFPR